MTVRLGPSGCIELVGYCPSEEAEALLQQLLRNPAATVDWRGCTGTHTAVIQLLMSAKARLLGPPADPGLARWIQPVLARYAAPAD
jgi:hypothetical protein